MIDGTAEESDIDMLIAEWRSGHKFIEIKNTVVSGENILAIAKKEPVRLGLQRTTAYSAIPPFS